MICKEDSQSPIWENFDQFGKSIIKTMQFSVYLNTANYLITNTEPKKLLAPKFSPPLQSTGEKHISNRIYFSNLDCFTK